MEAEFSKELRLKRQAKYFRRSQPACLLNRGIYEHRPHSFTLMRLVNSQGFYLRKVRPDYLKCAAADDLTIKFNNKKGLEICENISHRAKQHQVTLREMIYQGVYGLYISNICTANVHN